MNYKYWIHFVKNLKKNAIGLSLNKLVYAIEQKQDWELTGSDHELLIAKYRLKLKKLGKTIRPFRYDLIKSLMII